MRTKIVIPKTIKPRDRELLGEAVVEFIRSRTLEGKDKNNRKFAKYSKAYAERKGVSRDSVDLMFSGDMLDGIKLLNHKSGEITVGFDKDDELNGRAEGNIKGTYGQSVPVTKPRDFLGITKGDLEGLTSGLDDIEDVQLSDTDIDRLARKAAREILGIDFGDEV